MTPQLPHLSLEPNITPDKFLNPVIISHLSHKTKLPSPSLGEADRFPWLNIDGQRHKVTLMGFSPTDFTQQVLGSVFKWVRALELRLESGKGKTPAIASQAESDPGQNLVWEMIQALEQEDFTLNYQPQIELSTGQVLGVETLIRWHHQSLGQISPAEFIPIAEKTGLIVPIGYWVLKQSCLQYQKWRSLGIPPFKLSVNLSLRQLQEADLLPQIQTILEETQMNPRELALEVTESLMFQEPDKAIARLNRLKKLGIQIAIDDFGVGYSSLSYLKDLPVHTLKIDKSFLDDLLMAEKNQVILQSIIELGHRLTLKIIAEGVESQEQLNILKQMNCDYGQGYLFSRPLALPEMTHYFQNSILASPTPQHSYV